MGEGLSNIKNLGEGLTLYLQPLGIGRGGGLSFPLAGGALGFNALRLIVRSATGRVYDAPFPVAALDTLKSQLPKSLKDRFDLTLARLTGARPPIAGLDFSKPKVMGILNVTPDSFSDGGDFFSPDQARARVVELFETGADIVDAGAESTRPGSKEVTVEEELKRLQPVFEVINGVPGPVSIDTRKAAVIRAAIKAGAAVINDISALTFEDDSLSAAKGAPGIALMHLQGTPETMQLNPVYDDVVLDVYDYLEERIEACEAKGIARAKLIVDPGIGFGKTLEHNLDLLRDLSIFHGLGVPLLVGVSRKKFIGAITGVENPRQRLAGSLAAAMHAAGQGAQILRVHDVAETVQALTVQGAIYSNT